MHQPRPARLHYAWVILAVTGLTVVMTAGVSAVPAVLIHPAGSRLWLGSRRDCARRFHQRLPLRLGRYPSRGGLNAARRPAAGDADRTCS